MKTYLTAPIQCRNVCKMCWDPISHWAFQRRLWVCYSNHNDMTEIFSRYIWRVKRVHTHLIALRTTLYGVVLLHEISSTGLSSFHTLCILLAVYSSLFFFMQLVPFLWCLPSWDIWRSGSSLSCLWLEDKLGKICTTTSHQPASTSLHVHTSYHNLSTLTCLSKHKPLPKLSEDAHAIWFSCTSELLHLSCWGCCRKYSLSLLAISIRRRLWRQFTTCFGKDSKTTHKGTESHL